MITVEGPGGASVDFPEGTDATTIDNVMRQHFGGGSPAAGKPDGFDRNDPRFANMTSKSAISGIPGLGAAEPYVSAALNTVAHPITGVGHSDFATNLAEQKAANAAFDAEHPVQSGVSKAIGGALALGPLGATALGAKALGLTGETLAARAGAGALSGAGINAVDSLAHGEVPTAGQLISGAAVGVGAPVLGRIAGATARAIHGTTPEVAASASLQVARAIKSDALDAAGINAKLGELGPEATLADLGPNLRSQAEALAATPGPAQKIVVDAMTNRAEAAGGRIADALDQHLGPKINPTELAEQIVDRRRTAAKPLYDAAYATPISTNEEIEAVLGTPFGKVALQKAVTLAKSEPDVPLGMFAPKPNVQQLQSSMTAPEFRAWLKVNASGQPAAPRAVDVRGLDLTKRALDDLYDQAQRSGAGNRARVIDNLRKKLVGAIDQQAPHYPAARDVFAGESGIKDALENGRNIFSRTMPPDELAASMRGMSGAERDAFTQGARSAVADTMGSARNDALAARSLFDKGWTREKLELVLGKPTTDALIAHMEREATFHQTSSGVLGNSRTAARLAAQQEFPSAVKDPQIRHGMTPLDAALYVPRKIAGAVVGNRMREKAAKVGTDAAKALTATGPARDEVVRALLQKQLENAKSPAARAQFERLIAATFRGALPAVVNR